MSVTSGGLNTVGHVGLTQFNQVTPVMVRTAVSRPFLPRMPFFAALIALFINAVI